MISLTDTQSKRCRGPALALLPPQPLLRPVMNGASAAWGGGLREGGGRDRTTDSRPTPARQSFRGAGNGTVRPHLGSCETAVARGVESGSDLPSDTAVGRLPKIPLQRLQFSACLSFSRVCQS